VRMRAVACVGAVANTLVLAVLAPLVWGAQATGSPSVREGEHEGASYVISIPGKWMREQAFDDLVAWIERGVVPAGDDVLGDVTKLGLRWTPALHPADPARKP